MQNWLLKYGYCPRLYNLTDAALLGASFSHLYVAQDRSVAGYQQCGCSKVFIQNIIAVLANKINQLLSNSLPLNSQLQNSVAKFTVAKCYEHQ